MPTPFPRPTDGSADGWQTSSLICCRPMHDELAWGHCARIAWINGIRTESELAKIVLGDASTYLRWTPPVLKLMAEAAELPVATYMARHALEALNDLSVSPEEDAKNHDEVQWSFYTLKQPEGGPMACPVCVDDDISNYGFSWFRRAHHLPGVDWCSDHGASLCAAGPTATAPKSFRCIASLHRRQLVPIPDSIKWRDDLFVKRYAEQLRALIRERRPMDWPPFMEHLREAINITFNSRGRPAYDLIYGWVLSDAPNDWLTRHFGPNPREIAKRLNNVLEHPLPATDLALILACLSEPVSVFCRSTP